VAVSPDGRLVVSGGADGTVVSRPVDGGRVVEASRRGEVLAVDLDHQGRRVVTGDSSGDVVVATLPGLETGPKTTFEGLTVHATAFNPRTGVVAVAVGTPLGEEQAAPAGFLAIWDPATGREVAPRVEETGGDPIALAWTPDGTTLAASTDNNVLRFYRAGPTYRQVGDDLVSEDDTMNSLAVSPDGRTIAAGTSSGIVRQYDVASHEQVGPDLRGHTFQVWGVAYNPDGSTLASTTVGLGATRLWDAATGTPIGAELVTGRTPYTERTIPIDQPYPSRPAFSPDGRTLHTPVVDGSVVAWDLRPESWVRAACDIVGRDLTQAEWRQHVGDQDHRRTCSAD